MKDKAVFILISAVFVLTCACIVMGNLLNRQNNAVVINKSDLTAADMETSVSEITALTVPEEEKININSALKEELTQLYGIGEVIAQSIIDYREEYGKFDSIEEIKNVKGIGDKTYEKIKDRITV